MKKQCGAVLIFSLMILSIIIILTEQLIRSVMVGSSFTKTMITREHSEMLALGGINLAIAQLTLQDDESEKTEAADKDKVPPIKKFVLNLISNLNRFQTFDLGSKIDGVSGQLKVCISCEHGKININEAFDFKKQEFRKEFQLLLAGLEIPGKIPAGEFIKRITEFLKKRSKKLYDVTELIDVPGFEKLDAFYNPPGFDAKGNGQQNSDLALQDIFTIWSGDAKIDPLLFSDSLCAIFNLRRPRSDDVTKQKERFTKAVEDFKEDWGKDWDSNWKHLQNIYDGKPKVLSNVKDILVEKFDPKVYSVLSYARVENVEQRLLAIIKQVDENQDSKTEEKTQENDKKQVENSQSSPSDKKSSKSVKKFFKIVRLYWL